MSVSIMQSQTKVESGQEPDILIVNEGSPLNPSSETGADTSLVYDTDADFIAEWLRKVFCTMTLGRVARRLAKHTGYLAEVDPRKWKVDAWSTYAFILLGRPPEQRTEEDNLFLSRIIGAARALVSESARQEKEQPEERLPPSAPEKEKCKPKAEQPSAPKLPWEAALRSLAEELRWGPKPLYVDDPEACLEYVRDKIEQLRPWRNALRSIVPSRPEFVDNPDACAKYVQDKLAEIQDKLKQPGPYWGQPYWFGQLWGKCKACDDRGWLLVGTADSPAIKCCSCGQFSSDAAAISYVAAMASMPRPK